MGVPFFSIELVEGSTEFVLVFAFLLVGRTGTGDGGEPSEWRMVQRVNKYQPWKWVKTVRRQSTSWFREYDLLRKKGMQGS